MTDVPTAPRPSARVRPAVDALEPSVEPPVAPPGAAPAAPPAAGPAAPVRPSTESSDQVAVVKRAPRPEPPPSGFERLVVPPDTGGPRVRLGFLWFFLALAAVTSGRWWTAALTATVAAAGGYQLARAWAIARAQAELDALADSDPDRLVPPGTGRLPAIGAAIGAGAVPLAAGYGTGAAGAALVVVAVLTGVVSLASRATGATMAISALLPAVAASSIVLALQVDLWAALFLVLTVSLYDAGNFTLGADAAGRWEGPVGGVIGVLAVTFTMATIQVPPLDRAQWWIAGAVVAATCALGQWITSWFLPSPTTWVPAVRRLDAYLVAGPLLVATVWVMGA